MYKLNKSSSAFIDIVRVISCEMVLIGHTLGFCGFQQQMRELKIPIIQSLAVSILFILSGFLTIYSAKNKGKEYSYKDFFKSRFVRIYSVLIPGLIFIFIIDKINIFLFPELYGHYPAFNKSTFISNIFMLQNFPILNSISIFSKTTFGSGRPLWTLPIECFMYMIFGFVFYKLYNHKNKIVFILIALFCAIVPYFNFVFGWGNGLTFTWIIGMGVYLIVNKYKDKNVSRKTLLVFFCTSLILGYLRISNIKKAFGIDYDPIFSILIALTIAAGIMFAHTVKANPQRIMKPIKTFSGFAFSVFFTL